jgi:GNAT superfamily N-acetyltransferase
VGTSVLIEKLEPREVERLRGVRLRALYDAPEAFASTYEEALTRPREVWERQLADFATFVAVEAGRDVGLARGVPFDERDDTALLVSVWVAPEARGHGAGDALVAAVVDWARRSGYRFLALDVGDENPYAIALYARQGFLPNGEVSYLPAPREHVREHRRVRKL